jgi:ABC-2 type transport system permease protein
VNAGLRYRPAVSRRLAAFFSLARCTTQSRWTYRWSSFTNLLASALSCSIFFLVWQEVYRQNPDASFVPRKEIFSYLALAFVVNFALSVSVEIRFHQRMDAGLIAIDLTRPLGFFALQLGQAFGESVGNWVTASVVYFAAWCFLGDAALPASMGAMLLGVVSGSLAFLVNFGISYVMAQWLFFVTSFYGVIYMRLALHQIFSGLAAPLALFPPLLGAVAWCLPFRHVVETPVLIWLGMVSPSSVPGLLGAQIAWAVGLLLLGNAFFRHGLKRLQIQGG